MNKRKVLRAIVAGVMTLVLAAGFAVEMMPAPAQAASLQQQLKDLQEQKKEIDKEIEDLEGQLKENLSDMKSVVEQKNTIDQQIFKMYEQINNLNEQINSYNSMIADTQAKLDEAQAKLDALNAKNKERIRAMEEDGNLSYWSVLFQANSFSDLLDRLNMIEEIAASDQRRLNEMSAAAKEVEDTKATLEQERSALEESKKQMEASQVELEKKREEADKLLAELVAAGDEYQKLIDEAEADAKEIASDINKVEGQIKDESKPAQSKPTDKPTADDYYVESSAKWIVPCKYTKFTSPFGWRLHPVHKDWRFHYGVDLAAKKGTEIKATRSGKITTATYSSSAGYYVKIDHGDGFSSVYMHMTHYIVKKGDKVEQGDVIGYVGSTGTSTGNHLHFGIIYKGEYVNPAKYIKI